MKKAPKFFGNMTIRKRLIISNIILFAIPTGIVLILLYGQFFNIIQSNILDTQKSASAQVAANIGNDLENMESACAAIVTGNNLERSLEMAMTNHSDPFMITDLKALEAVVNSMETQNVASDVVIYFEDAKTVEYVNTLLDNKGIFRPLSDVGNTYWMGIFDSLNDNMALSDWYTMLAPEYYLSEYEAENCGTAAMMKKRVYTIDGTNFSIYVAVYQDVEVFSGQLKDALTYEDAMAYIINSRDYIVTDTENANVGTYMVSYETLETDWEGEGSFQKANVASQDVFLAYRDIPDEDWRVVWIIPYESILHESMFAIYQFIIVYIALVGVVFLVAINYSNSIVKRISSLRVQMGKMKEERPTPVKIEAGKDEVGELIEAYNFMVQRINTLSENALNAANELNAMKIKALRAQIDPHFLYDTLDMINWSAKGGETEKVSEAVMALSRFYRLTLNKGSLMSTVQAELEHVSLYVKLMNMRFKNKIEYIVDVPDEMMHYQIPMIVFQPIVENAIQHGIFEKPNQTGRITITGWEEEDALCFVIADDGIGMTKEQLEMILERDQNSSDKGIGVYNTHRRLQLVYNSQEFGLSYDGEFGVGTEVTFRIPKQQEEQQKEQEDKHESEDD